MAPMLTTLSPEILHEICLNIDPPDLASLSRTCHFLDGFVSRDDLLWKFQYLDQFVRHLRLHDRKLIFKGRTRLKS